MKRKGKMTATKAAAMIGGLSGAAVFVKESKLDDPNITQILSQGNFDLATRAFIDRVGNSQNVTRGVIKGVIAASLPPLAVALSKKAVSVVRSI